jgi:hypothetical protein
MLADAIIVRLRLTGTHTSLFKDLDKADPSSIRENLVLQRGAMAVSNGQARCRQNGLHCRHAIIVTAVGGAHVPLWSWTAGSEKNNFL